MSKKVVVFVLLVASISAITGFIIGMSTPSVIAGDYDNQIVKQLKKLNGNLDTLNSRLSNISGNLRRLERAID